MDLGVSWVFLFILSRWSFRFLNLAVFWLPGQPAGCPLEGGGEPSGVPLSLALRPEDQPDLRGWRKGEHVLPGQTGQGATLLATPPHTHTHIRTHYAALSPRCRNSELKSGPPCLCPYSNPMMILAGPTQHPCSASVPGYHEWASTGHVPTTSALRGSVEVMHSPKRTACDRGAGPHGSELADVCCYRINLFSLCPLTTPPQEEH